MVTGYPGGARYGKSQNRDNGLAPVLINEFSSRPFGYQHIFISGSAPQKDFIHEEAQLQLYYRMKADYFHFAFFQDLNDILVADYSWQKQDFSKSSDKHVEKTNVDIGLDFGPFSFTPFSGSSIEHGFKIKDKIESLTYAHSKYKIRYRNHYMSLGLLYGYTDEEEDRRASVKFTTVRSNFDLSLWRKFSLGHSFIYRKFKAQTYNYTYTEDYKEVKEVSGNYHGKSYTNAFYGNYYWRHKYVFQAMISHEMSFSLDHKSDHYLKFGLSANLLF